MKKLLNYLTVLLVMLVFQDCSDDDSTEPTTITANAFTVSIDENPNNGDIIGTVSAAANDGSTLTFSLNTQSVAGALALDASTGELTVADASVFDYETNTAITAEYKASNEITEATGTISITINDDPDDTAFITTWETSSANELIMIPVDNETVLSYNYNVDWGDGTTSSNQTGEAVHTYANAGRYQVKITGTFPAICVKCGDLENNETKIKSIDQWGTIAWATMESAFWDCSNLVSNATDTPDLSQVMSMKNMFRNATAFNGDISNWDVSNITSMSSMFNDATAFNGDISDWNVSNVTDMSAMFYNATAFNQNLGGWNVGNVTNCSFFVGGTSTLNSLPNFTQCDVNPG